MQRNTNQFKVTSATLLLSCTSNYRRTSVDFTDGKLEYQFFIDGNYTFPVSIQILEMYLLPSFSEYELIESIKDEELKLDYLTEYLTNQELELCAS